MSRAEPLARDGGAAYPVDLIEAGSTLHQVVDVLGQEAGDALLDQLGRGAATQREDRCAGHHALDHCQTKRLRPLQREDPSGGPRDEPRLLGTGDVGVVLDRGAEERLDLLFEVPQAFPRPLHLASQDQLATGAPCHLDGEVLAFVGGDPGHLDQVALVRDAGRRGR